MATIEQVRRLIPDGYRMRLSIDLVTAPDDPFDLDLAHTHLALTIFDEFNEEVAMESTPVSHHGHHGPSLADLMDVCQELVLDHRSTAGFQGKLW